MTVTGNQLCDKWCDVNRLKKISKFDVEDQSMDSLMKSDIVGRVETSLANNNTGHPIAVISLF